ncbi:hypothetical protein [Clostridium perfringens]|uniref:Cap15 family cyclic dinucleotide receptor domain-containing protein n=1 Tax=Clostridium perfringens TaxID=1502 RepID=UPI003A10226D
MHTYSIDSDIRKKIIIYITILSIAIILLISLITNAFGINFFPLNINKETIGPAIMKLFTTTVTLTGILYAIFDKWLWKVWIFNRFHNIPNLNGKWEGTYKSSYKDDNGNNFTGKSNIKIKQTWSKIEIKSLNEKSESYSLLAGIYLNRMNGIELRYEYFNNTNNTLVNTMNKHFGLNAFTYHEDIDTLIGEYYTNKDRQTYGVITVKRVGKEK